jgi:hypothetical protein
MEKVLVLVGKCGKILHSSKVQQWVQQRNQSMSLEWVRAMKWFRMILLGFLIVGLALALLQIKSMIPILIEHIAQQLQWVKVSIQRRKMILHPMNSIGLMEMARIRTHIDEWMVRNSKESLMVERSIQSRLEGLVHKQCKLIGKVHNTHTENMERAPILAHKIGWMLRMCTIRLRLHGSSRPS